MTCWAEERVKLRQKATAFLRDKGVDVRPRSLDTRNLQSWDVGGSGPYDHDDLIAFAKRLGFEATADV